MIRNQVHAIWDRLRRVDWVIACAVGCFIGLVAMGLLNPPDDANGYWIEDGHADQFAMPPGDDDILT